MRRFVLISSLIIFIAGCSAYKELSPDPEIDPRENGYIEIKNDEENFFLESDSKYFIKFPSPAQDNIYLVLQSDKKEGLETFMTASEDFEDEKTVRYKDIYPGDPSKFVYEIDNKSIENYWVIENIREDTELDIDYRYVPVWRFNFENKYRELNDFLGDNTVSRKLYGSIDKDYDTDKINFDQEIKRTKIKLDNLLSVEGDLRDLNGIFPDAILNSNDEGFRSYGKLTSDFDDELRFQKEYLSVLGILKMEYDSRENVETFLQSAPSFIGFLENSGNYPPGVSQKVKDLLSADLDMLIPYFKSEIFKKNDLKTFTFTEDLQNAGNLFAMTNKSKPKDFDPLSQFVERFNYEIVKMEIVDNKKMELEDFFEKTGIWPSNYFYVEAQKKLREIKRILPESQAVLNHKFGNSTCAVKLDRKIKNETIEIARLETNYKLAEDLLPRINSLRAEGNYKTIIGILLAHKELDFLANQYPDIDRISLNSQLESIEQNLTNSKWAEAESGLRNLYNDTDFLNYQAIQPKKMTGIKKLEEDLFTQIRNISKSAVDTFVVNNQQSLLNIDELYGDSVFIPKYILTFSSAGATDLSKKNNQIAEYIDKMKHIDFPERSINYLYSGFIKDISNKGAEKANAIVKHGKYYNGTNEKIKSIIIECDYDTPKLIKRAKEYRRIYALPTSDTPSGRNQYKFKVQLQIPSDAEFPVFDINIKLPEVLAENASSEQWYDEITINSVQIKNEGRIKITAPLPENDYECQISPVQMDKYGKNILEVTFTSDTYEVFEISVMAQKPIIKKN